MIIETERLILRSFVPDDLDDYFTQIYGDAEVMKYISGGMARSRERTNDVLQFAMRHEKTYGFSIWALLDKRDKRFIGHCGLVHPGDSEEVELVCALGRDFQAQGIGPEGAEASLRFGFETAGLQRIIALAYPDNRASQRGMEKLGMKYVGLTDLYYHTTLISYVLEHHEWQPTTAFYQLTN